MRDLSRDPQSKARSLVLSRDDMKKLMRYFMFWGLKGDSSEHSKEFKASMAFGEFESATDVCLSCSCCRFLSMEFHTSNGKPGL